MSWSGYLEMIWKDLREDQVLIKYKSSALGRTSIGRVQGMYSCKNSAWVRIDNVEKHFYEETSIANIISYLKGNGSLPFPRHSDTGQTILL